MEEIDLRDKLAELRQKCTTAELLLFECLEFLNKVPNNKYGNNYRLCRRIENLLDED